MKWIIDRCFQSNRKNLTVAKSTVDSNSHEKQKKGESSNQYEILTVNSRVENEMNFGEHWFNCRAKYYYPNICTPKLNKCLHCVNVVFSPASYK